MEERFEDEQARYEARDKAKEMAREKRKLEEKKNHEINVTRGEAARELKSHPSWPIFMSLLNDIKSDLQKEMFMPVRQGMPIYAESMMGQVVAHRRGQIDGLENLLKLLEKLETVYLNNKEAE